MNRTRKPVFAWSRKTAHRSFERALSATVILALAAILTTCNLRPISRSLTWYGYMDTTGQIVIPMKFRNAMQFSEGLAAVQVDGKWGYIDQKGQFVIEPRFLTARDFKQGRAKVEVEPDRWCYIDRTGKAAFNIDFKWGIYAREFSDGLAAVYIEDPNRFECLSSIHQNVREDYDGNRGYISTKFCGRWGFIRQDGTFAVEPQFIEAFDFSEELAAVRIQDPNVQDQRLWRYGYIDRTGAMVIREQFGVAWPFSDGLARVQIGSGRGIVDRWGYIDRSGNVVISHMLKAGWPFREGLALVGNGGPI